jgi:hypothetical protein
LVARRIFQLVHQSYLEEEMESQTTQKNKGKRIGLSVLAGFGFGLLAFVIFTVLGAVGFFYLWTSSGAYFMESAYFLTMIIAPTCGLLAALIAALVGGLAVYRRKSRAG